MKSIKPLIFLVILIFLFSMNGKATHMMGGEITWSCVGKDSFMVTLVVYRNCNGAPLGTPTIYAKCATTGVSVSNVTISKPAGVDITPTCVSSCTRCQSSSCSFPYGIEQYTFSKLIVLSGAGSCCGITLKYEEQSRNGSITTGAAGQNCYIEASLNRCITPCDNSPSFTNPPLTIICVGEDFSFNHGVIDIDVDSNGGLIDSISYEWTPPLQGANSPTSWTGSYAYDKPLFFWGFPNNKLPFPRGIQLDGVTGDISFRPMKVEQTVMGIKVSEWRKISGKMTRIGVVSRDIQIIVISCPTNHAPVLSGSYYKEVCAGDTVSFMITTNDYDTTNTLTISWDKSIKGAVWRDSNGMVKHPTGFLTLITDTSMVSSIPLSFKVTVNDDACPVNGRRTGTYQILVKPLPKASITKVDSGCGVYYFIAKGISGKNPTYLWKGNFSPGFNKTGSSMSYKFNGHGKYPYTMEMISDKCSTIYYDTVEVDTLLEIQKAKSINACVGDTISLVANYKYNKGPVKFYWSTGDTTQTISYVCIKNAKVQVIVSDTICQVFDTVKISVESFPTLDLGKDKLYCPGSLLNLPVNGLRSSDTLYFYNKQTGMLISKDTMPVVSDSGIYMIKVISEYGCIGTDEVRIFRFNKKNSYIDDLSVCYKNDIVLHADFQKNKYSTVSYNWYELPGKNLLFSGNDYMYNLSKSKKLLLKIEELLNISVCDDTDTITLTPIFPSVKIDNVIKFCKIDSLYNLNNFFDTTKGKMQIDHWAIVNKQFFNPYQIGSSSILFKAKLLDFKTSCTFDTNINARIHNLPIVFVSTPNQRKEFCPQFGLISLTPNPSGGKWFGAVDSLNRFNTNCPNGVYPIYYQYVDPYGCQNSYTLVLKIGNPKISILNKNENKSCLDEEIPLKASFSIASGMKWSADITSIGYFKNNETIPENTYISSSNDLKNGTCWIYAQTTDAVCVNDKDSVQLSYGSIPKALFNIDVSSTERPQPVKFINESTVKFGKVNVFLWDFGDGDTSNLENPQHVYQDSGWFDVSLYIKTDHGCTDSIEKKSIIYAWPLSIKDQTNGLNIRVFPNPAQDKIEIVAENETGISKVQLFNFLGVKIREFEFENQKNFEIEKVDLPAGVYFLKITDSDSIIYKFQILFL